MKTALTAIFIFTLALGLAAQSLTPPAPAKVELAPMLTDLDKVVSATNTDLASLQIDKWSAGWKTGFTKKSSHKKDAEQTADSLKQLTGTLPAMITQVSSSHGNISSAFKLYNTLTTVCENMDTLVEATQTYGKKEEYSRLSGDHANLVRARNTLAAYVEQRAAVVDPRGDSPAAAGLNASAKKSDSAPHSKKTMVSRKKVVLRSSN